jgi:DNA-binding beta-propeller fold protein YncE
VDTVYGESGTGQGQFLAPVDIDIAPNGNIFVAERDGGRIQVFDESMRFLSEVGSGQLAQPVRIAVDDSSKVYVRDGNNSIKVFDSTGTLDTTISISSSIRDFDLGSNAVFVANHDDSIIAYSVDGVQIRSWGGNGSSDGHMSTILWLCVSQQGKVVASDQNNMRVQIFDTLGTLESIIGLQSYPGAVAVDSTGRIFVIENGKILKMFDAQGDFIAQHKFATYGTFTDPMGMSIAPDGTIYVVLQASNNILKITLSLP